MSERSATSGKPSGLHPESVVIFLVTATVVLHVGFVAIGVHHRVNWDGLSALGHAVDVLYLDDAVNLALIGFVEPPATPLLYLPLAALYPHLSHVGYATCAMGAVLLGWSALLLNGLALRLGLAWWARYVVVAVLVLHPVSLSYAALGSPLVLLLTAVLGMTSTLAAWAEKLELRDLISCSAYATVALLTRYEAVVLVAAAVIYMALRGAGRVPERYSRIEGLLITYLLPIAYFGGLWVVSNWLIMGDPWYSVRATFAGAVPAPEHWSTGVLVTALVVFPLSYALAYHELRPPGPWGASAGAALLMAAAIAAPLLWPRLYTALGDGAAVAWWPSLAGMAICVLATSLVLVVLVAAQYLGAHHSEQDAMSHRPLGGSVLLAIAGLFIMMAMRPAGLELPTSPQAALRGHVAFAHSAEAEQQVAALVAHEVEAGHQVVIAGWPGFAIALYSGAVGQVQVLPEEAPDEQVARMLRPGDLLVLLGKEAQWDRAVPDYALVSEWYIGDWRGIRVTEEQVPPEALATPPETPVMR